MTRVTLTKIVNGEPVEMSEAEEQEFLASQRDPVGRRGQLRAALERSWQARLEQGLSYQNKRFSLDESSQRRITSAYSLAQDAKVGGGTWPNGFAWRSNDNSYLSLPTPDDAISFARAMAGEATRLQFALFQRKDTLAAMPDGALDGFDPNASWDQP